MWRRLRCSKRKNCCSFEHKKKPDSISKCKTRHSRFYPFQKSCWVPKGKQIDSTPQNAKSCDFFGDEMVLKSVDGRG
ncbi:hypothetical protein L1987_19309 [Smallanthus sonchifolius]|uniref:Uncharacterized protein n=1 Tax=Smallanthus sonchifolius TaxID=185202 RepID=A0ACB9IQC8_9ASTR|nr:hypothetical protein L1987_19309 [Smallanthus sonchifolius]